MCPYCSASLHTLCLAPTEVEATGQLGCCCDEEVITIAAESSRGGATKAPEEMRDPTSTGRKRAAQLKPISEGMQCEWAHLYKAGGGVIPIVGCAGNSAVHIHHGPDKDTTNNDDPNLHRVCTNCHNRWHSLNDRFYGKRPPAGTPFVPIGRKMEPHDPETQATLEQVFDSELWWSTKVKSKPYIHTPEDLDERPTSGDAGTIDVRPADDAASAGISN